MSIPLMWFAALYRMRDRLNPAADTGLVLWMRERDPQLAPLRFLFAPYQPRYYYWEGLELYRRIAFIGILVIFFPAKLC
jgi:hypothetical protein